jgi:hypothetical protein
MGLGTRVSDYPATDRGRLIELQNPPAIPDDAFFAVHILEWRPVFRASLLGKFDATLGGVVDFFDNPLLVGNDGAPWAGLPGRVRIGRDGKIVLNSTGRPHFDSCVAWRGRDVKARWTKSVIDALIRQFGENCLIPPAGRSA